MPLKFGYEHRVTEIPYATFHKRGGKNNEVFLDRNPILEELFRSDAGNDNQDNVFTYEELTDHEKYLMPYINYICAIVELYAHLCLDHNVPRNIDMIMKSGISFTHCISVIKNNKIHVNLRRSYSYLIKVLFIDCEPFISIEGDYNRCYFWESLDLKADRTITNWDRVKIESVNFNENIDALEKKIAGTKTLRKFITSMIFHHQGFPETKKFINDKEKLVNVDKINVIVGYLDNLVQIAAKIIEYSHTDMEFIETCMKISAYILITDYSDYAQEMAMQDQHLSKGIWLIKFLWKVKKLKYCKDRIEGLLLSTCGLLKIICRSRMNRQIMLFLQLFKKYTRENIVPDIGSYFEIFARDFESLFKIHSFNLIREKLPKNIKRRILMVKEQEKHEREEEIKRQESDSGSEKSSENENDEEQEIKVKHKTETEHSDDELEEEDVGLSIYSNNVIIPLDMYILKMIFSQKGNITIQNKAIDILIDNFAQRKYLVNEINKIELIITEEDVTLYHLYKDHYNRIKKLMKHLIQDDYEYLILQNLDKERYKNRIRDTSIVIKNIKSTLKHLYYFEGTSFRTKYKSVYYEKSDMERIKSCQKIKNIMRQLGMHTLLIESMKMIYYRHLEHSGMFAAILKFLQSFCMKNRTNQDVMLPHINYLLSLHQWDLDSPQIISEILKPHRKSEYGLKFFKYILDRIIQRNLFNAPLFNLLVVFADAQSTENDIQMFIINRIIKQPKLREIMMETNHASKKIELIEIYQKKRRTLKDVVALQEKDFLDAHLALISLYSK